MRYRGDGVYPDGSTPETRGEKGRYLADSQLVSAVNTALAVEQPLLVTGDPGTGKTTLAWSVASELGLGPVLEFHTRSDHQARDVLYESTTCCGSTTRRSATNARRSPRCTSSGTRSARRSDRRSAASCSSTKSTRRRATSRTICSTRSTAWSSASRSWG